MFYTVGSPQQPMPQPMFSQPPQTPGTASPLLDTKDTGGVPGLQLDNYWTVLYLFRQLFQTDPYNLKGSTTVLQQSNASGTPSSTSVMFNAQFASSGAFTRIDPTQPAWMLQMANDSFTIYHTAAGAGSISWTALAVIDPTGALTMTAGLTATTLTSASITATGATISFNSKRLVSAADPVGAQDVMTLAYALAHFAYTAGTGLSLAGNVFSLSVPVSLANGGTNATTAAGALISLGAAASGANTDIASLASPALASATATTQAPGDSSTKVATTAFVATGFSTPASIQKQTATFGVDTGAANAYAIALTPAVGAYQAGDRFSFFAVHANTGASTLDAGAGAKAITKAVSGALTGGEILTGGYVDVAYDGTQFQLIKTA